MQLNKKGFHYPWWIHCHHLKHLVAGGSSAGSKCFPVWGIVGILLIPCLWHIPAWTKAKHDGTEKQYQSQVMWPQQVFNAERSVN